MPIADFDQGSLADFPFTGYVGSAPWVQSHPNTVAAFLRALNEGQELADTDRQAVEQAMEKYTGIKPIIAATMAIDSYPLEIDVPPAAAGGRLDVRVRADAGYYPPLQDQRQ